MVGRPSRLKENRMHRRKLLGLIGSTLGAALAGAAPGSVLAHHGWSSFDPNRPLYLRGRIKAVRWRNPSQFDGKAILAATKLVPRTDVVWTVELAPLTRMQAWGVEPLKEGETVEIVGYTLTDQSEPVLRAEWLFRAGKTYGLRSSPA